MQEVTSKEIIENDYLLAPSAFKWIKFKTTLDHLKSKYENLLDNFDSFDGYSFPSSDYVTQYEGLKDKTPLIQIGNVNQDGWVLVNDQKFEYLPNKFLSKKRKYLLDKKYVLISLTGGSDLENDISCFYENDFPVFLNQRVGAFYSKDTDENLMYYFFALTKHSLFRFQWIGKGGIQKNTVANERNSTYLPLIKNQNTIQYVALLTQSIINKEKEIRYKHQLIHQTISEELNNNQLPKKV